MNEEKLMRCPHCLEVGKVIWVGFAKEWVICQSCQRRIRWEEVRRNYLITDEDAWEPALTTTPTYN